MISAVFSGPAISAEYDFGDSKSVTLVSKSWGALTANDLEAVLAYTNKCLELFGEEAAAMQNSLDGYPDGSQDEVFAYWALNDVATCLFIEGEAYKNAGMLDEAKAVYQRVVNEYTYGQSWDPKGWFWKPAEAAEKEIEKMNAN